MNGIQNYCREFRVDVLKITLVKMQDVTGTNYKSISAFENGRSKNVNYLFDYVTCCDTQVQQQIFINGLGDILQGK